MDQVPDLLSPRVHVDLLGVALASYGLLKGSRAALWAGVALVAYQVVIDGQRRAARPG